MLLDWMLAGLFVLEIVVALLCVQRSAEPTDNAVTGPALPAMYHSVSPADLPRTTEPLSPLPPAHEGQAVFFLIYENVSCFL